MKRSIGAFLITVIIVGILLGCGHEQAGPASPPVTPVVIDGVEYPRDTKSLDLSGTAITEWENLTELTCLTALDLRETGMTIEQYHTLQNALPGCSILWTVSADHFSCDSDATALTLEDITPGDAAALSCLTALETVAVTGCTDSALLLQTMQALPQVRFLWDFEVCGVSVSTDTTELDLSGIPMENTEELESWLPYFYDLQKVDMCGCGISNEEMDALNKRYMGTQFIWTVSIGPNIALRTDETYFMPAKLGYEVTNGMCDNLRYCTELICIDLGHMKLTDCSFLEYTPHVQYLVLADSPIADLTPVGTLKELRFLEIFLTETTDYWPLTNCTALEDLNLCYNPFGGDYTPLFQMTWLDRLWMAANGMTLSEQQALKEALPGTHIIFNSQSSTNKGWRMSPKYYQMRDIVGMYYMTK